MQKKDDKMGNKTAYKRKGEKKTAKKNGNRFAKKRSNFGLCACTKAKKLLNYIQLTEI